MADLYAPITRKTSVLAGSAGPLPYAVANWSDEALRNLDGVDPSFGLVGLAYWPVIVTDPAFNPEAEALTDVVTLGMPDPATFTVPGARGKRELTTEEIIASVTPIISSRQFFQQLAKQSDISKDEALAYVRQGALPKRFDDAINAALPSEAQFDARMAIIGANEFDIRVPLSLQLGALLQKSPADMVSIWKQAIQLQ